MSHCATFHLGFLFFQSSRLMVLGLQMDVVDSYMYLLIIIRQVFWLILIVWCGVSCKQFHCRKVEIVATRLRVLLCLVFDGLFHKRHALVCLKGLKMKHCAHCVGLEVCTNLIFCKLS